MSLIGKIGSSFVYLAFIFGIVGIAAAQQPAVKPLPPLSEAKIVDLIDNGIEEEAIVTRIRKGGIAFVLDPAAIARLEKAGASSGVIGAVREVAKNGMPMGNKPRVMLWTEGAAGDTNHLESEISINGKPIGSFKTETKQFVELNVGWNDIAIKTTPTNPSMKCRGLWLYIGGVVEEQPGKIVMNKPLWSFLNSNGWQFKDGTYIHDFGPRAKNATLTFKVYFAGLDTEGVKISDDDYVIRADSTVYQGDASSATIYVNGHPLNTFLNTEREVVITPFLKPGHNEIKLVTTPVKNGTYDGARDISILGPMEYNGQRKEWQGRELLTFRDQTGWKRNARTQLLQYSEDPAAESSEDVYSFFQEPKVAEAAKNKPRLMLSATVEPYDRNCLASDITINGQEVGRFGVETRRYLDGFLKPGWNEVQIKTTPLKRKVDCQGLHLSIGLVKQDEENGGEVMSPKLWSFSTHKGWRFEEGEFAHDTGTTTKDVTLSFRILLGDLDKERRKAAEGDYVLNASSGVFNSDAVTGTVQINDHLVTTFFNTDRSLVITPFLNTGKNVVKVISKRVANNTYGSSQGFQIVGPLEANAQKKTLTGPVALTFKSMDGWERVEKTQQLVYKSQPQVDSSEEVLTFEVTSLPK